MEHGNQFMLDRKLELTKKLSRIITQDNFDIRKQSRLWDDYNIILKYLKKV